MYLKSITLKGFKSFPDRTRLEFGPGVSVIVGPERPGKSNVTDAVLWALGEQSPVAVRGQSMQDVIFGGTPGRQAAAKRRGRARARRFRRALGLGVPEVSILRRLDRSGEGEYRLAGARCRLVDVIEVLSDTGLGKEMHSVISQGRVESIVTSKPRDRRLLIEEAAGLGKHRKRRRRAQLKLERTQENLDRALDVEREARSRLRPLKRQAEAAELHARLERQQLETRWELARDDLRTRGEALEQAKDRATQARAQREEVERRLEQVGRRREAAEDALARRSAEREELSRRSFLAQSAVERVGYRVEAVRAAEASVEGRLSRARAMIDALEKAGTEEVTDPDAPERIAALQGALDALDRDREAELKRQLADLEAAVAAAATEAERCGEAVQATTRAREQAEAQLEEARAGVREAERVLEGARREAARVGGELAAVNQFIRSHATLPGAPTSLADQLEVDPGYELAVAAVLDGRLRAAVVDERQDAAALLDRAGADGGRALVLAAADDSAPRQQPDPPTRGAKRLDEIVRGPGEALVLARGLLRGAWVVEAIEEVPSGFTGIAVTRAGRVWSASTSELRQAPAGGEERVLAERNRREELIKQSEAAVRGEQNAVAGLERAGSALAGAERERERTVAAHRAAVRTRDDATEEERRLQAQIDRRRAAPDDGPNAGRRAQLVAELAAERGALERAERERTERAGQLQRLSASVTRDEGLRPALARLLGALEGAVSALQTQKAAFDEALAADKEVGEHVAEELRACARRGSRTSHRASPLQRDADRDRGRAPAGTRPGSGFRARAP